MKIIECRSPDDTKLILTLAVDCCAEHGEERVGGKLDLAHYESEWKRLLRGGNAIMFGAVDESGAVYGGLGGVASRVMLTGILTAIQLFWYVTPEHRNGLTAIRLLDGFEIWAAQMGCQSVEMNAHDGMGHAEQFYGRRGYKMIQTMYRKQI